MVCVFIAFHARVHFWDSIIVEPLYVFSFLRTFVDILRDYFGQTSAETLKDNFDVVYQVSYNGPLAIIAYSSIVQLLEETLDASGHPSTTYPNALRDIVLPPSLLQKVLSVAGVAGLANPAASTQPFSSPIPWRKTGVRYNNNEIFFDISEELRAIVNKWVPVSATHTALSEICLIHTCISSRAGTSVTNHVWGKVISNSKLSG